MFENIEVEKMFEDQTHERHKFKVSIQGDDYIGIFIMAKFNGFIHNQEINSKMSIWIALNHLSMNEWSINRRLKNEFILKEKNGGFSKTIESNKNGEK